MNNKRKVINENNCVRRIRFSTTMETTAQNDDSIVVYVRLKPFEDSSEEKLFDYNSTNIKYGEVDKRGNVKLVDYSFHKVFFPKVSQKEIYKSTVDKDVDLFLSGENRLIFAYGTTSSGKTYTLLGTNEEPGILPRCTVKLFLSVHGKIETSYLCPDQGADLRVLSDQEAEEQESYRLLITDYVKNCEEKLLNKIDGLTSVGELDSFVDKLMEDEIRESNDVDDEASYSVWMSYLEVYNENIFDLLRVEKKPLKMGFDSKKDNYVKGLLHIQVSSWIDMWHLFLFGRSRLHTNETQLNKVSSRSHSILTIKLVKTKNDRSTVSSLSVCDLAGSERQKKALNVGDSLVESRNINTSLMILNRCFNAVRENKATNRKIKPPYRDSKLTMIFQKAFSYGEQITMFVNLSQNPVLLEESKQVLKMSAIAQEMVKQMPKRQNRLLKPNSRFSILCSEPYQPFSQSQGLPNHSGFMYLRQSSQLSNETIQSLEDKIKRLEEELKIKDEENKSLVEMVEDGRAEFLNIEKKLEESEKKNSQLEMENEDLENDLADLEMLSEARAGALKETLNNLSEALEKVESLSETVQRLEAELLEHKEPGKTKKVRPLMNAQVHLDQTDSDLLSDFSLLMNCDVHSTLAETSTKMKQPQRKCKKK